MWEKHWKFYLCYMSHRSCVDVRTRQTEWNRKHRGVSLRMLTNHQKAGCGRGGQQKQNQWQVFKETQNDLWRRLTFRAGRAIAQAVSRRLPTAEARVRAQVRSCGICGGQSGTGAGFLRVRRFPLPFLIPPMLHIHHHLSSGTGTIGQLVADVPSGLSLTALQGT
jgi:hypothetical protein